MATQGLVTKYGKPRLVAPPWTPLRAMQQAVPIQAALQQATEALTVIRFIGSKEVVDAADRCADVIVKLGDTINAGTATHLPGHTTVPSAQGTEAEKGCIRDEPPRV